jgi:hypothetical protein
MHQTVLRLVKAQMERVALKLEDLEVLRESVVEEKQALRSVSEALIKQRLDLKQSADSRDSIQSLTSQVTAQFQVMKDTEGQVRHQQQQKQQQQQMQQQKALDARFNLSRSNVSADQRLFMMCTYKYYYYELILIISTLCSHSLHPLLRSATCPQHRLSSIE